ncbi:MAG: DUF3501 family protein [Gammaproteobacteria bacterium]|nr:MAG: DUF3501 family protein [Gammaproteobacteria bacterium]
MAKKIERHDLMTLEEYAQKRSEFRQKALAHKRSRMLAIGPNATLFFEDRLTIQYQVQEMLRIEKLFEPKDIEDELAAYNPLIPDGHNWKATFMLEFEDEQERRAQLRQLVGIESKIWAQIGENDKIFAIANEDLERSTDEKTSAVHFLRFELSDKDIADLKSGASLAFGIAHPNYNAIVAPVPETLKQQLMKDLNAG